MEHTKQKFPLVAQVREMNEKNYFLYEQCV